MQGITITERMAKTVTLNTTLTIEVRNMSTVMRRKFQRLIDTRVNNNGYSSAVTEYAYILRDKFTTAYNLESLIWQTLPEAERKTYIIKGQLLGLTVRATTGHLSYHPQRGSFDHLVGNDRRVAIRKASMQLVESILDEHKDFDHVKEFPKEEAFRQELQQVIKDRSSITMTT